MNGQRTRAVAALSAGGAGTLVAATQPANPLNGLPYQNSEWSRNTKQP